MPFLPSPAARAAFALLALAVAAPLSAEIAPPTPTDDRLVVDLVAQEPEVLTPTAIDVDSRGRIWVLENNTHFRPKNYPGPPTDQVLILDDFGPDGHARKISVFADGFSNGMGLRLLPDGVVIVSTRAEIFRLRDTAGQGRADERVSLLKMDTKDDYPHNGLSGITLDHDGHFYVGLGENHGSPWKITGSDGVTIHGSDEGGVFRADLNGAKLERFALGFWNPFGLTFDDQGRLFALDNDPGAGSLCRLLEVVKGGDFGFRYRYGRIVDHPFLSWFGQIPGTLPPVTLVGEAPTGIIQCHTGLSSADDERLLGCTWCDHGIQRLPLTRRGASFSCTPEWVLRGGNDFRPSGLAQAPDGSLVISDWVDGSYEVHGKGRVWRLRRKSGEAASANPAANRLTKDSAETKLDALLKADDSPAASSVDIASLSVTDPYLFHAAITVLASGAKPDLLSAALADSNPRVRLAVLLAYRRGHERMPDGIQHLPLWLGDADGAVRRAALQWIAEDRLADFRPQLEKSLQSPLTRQTFLAYLATIQMLVSGKPDTQATISETRQIALDPARPADLRALSLQLLPVDEAAIPGDQLANLLKDVAPAVRREALHILAARRDDASQARLRTVAIDSSADAEFRADALAGLAASAEKPETQQVLHAALVDQHPIVRNEALRALRGSLTEADYTAVFVACPSAERPDLLQQLLLQTRTSPAVQSHAADPALAASAASHPPATQPWPAVLQGQGDPAAGRRLFYHPKGPRCYTCHSIENRGGNVGPDLTQVSTFSPEQLLTAIREPSKDIAPAFTQYLLKLKDGREVSGIDAFEDNKSEVILIDATGARTKYKVADIVSRTPLPVSLMPPALDYAMTEQELRDLLAFLREPRD